MSNEPLGIVEEGQSRVSRFAKFFYRPPEMRQESIDTAKLSARIAELEAENLKLAEQARDLETQNARLKASGKYIPLTSIAKPSEVANVFCRTLKEVGYEIDGLPYTLDHLLEYRRSQVVARPRHVFMWVARRTCSGDSLTALGRFLKRDHTSVMHGCQRATKIMQEDAALRGVALAVLATFGIKIDQ